MNRASECPNCRSPVYERFCARCGQRQLDRLSIGQVLRDAAARVFDTDAGFVRTLRDLTFAPGRVPRDYVAGMRRRYLSPVTYYILAASAQLLTLIANGEVLSASVAEGLAPEARASLQAQGIAEPGAWMAERYMLLVQNAYTWLGVFTFVIPMTLALRMLLPSRGNLAEFAVFALYVLSHIMLVTAILSLVTARVSPALHAVLSGTLYFVYAGWSAWGAFGRRVWPLFAGLLAMLIAYVSFFAALILGGRLMMDPGFLA